MWFIVRVPRCSLPPFFCFEEKSRVLVVDRLKQSPPPIVFSFKSGKAVKGEILWIIVTFPQCSWCPPLFLIESRVLVVSPPPLPAVFPLPVWSSSGGCNFVVYRGSTPVQLAPTFVYILEFRVLIADRLKQPPPPLYFCPSSQMKQWRG